MKCLNPVVEFGLEVLRIGVTWRVFTRVKSFAITRRRIYIFSKMEVSNSSSNKKRYINKFNTYQ